MRIDGFKQPKSSFLSVEKDFSIIIDKILSNQRLKKLLYYTDKDCISKPNLTDEQSLSLFGDNIKITPKVKIDKEVKNYLVIFFDSFSTNITNPEFRDNLLVIDIICHFDSWQLKDFQLRPFLIAAEIDSMLNNQKLTGIGKLEFAGMEYENVSDEFGSYRLTYYAIHGEEDKKFMLNPQDDEQFIKDFFERVNNQ